jgi:hypothetical protein
LGGGDGAAAVLIAAAGITQGKMLRSGGTRAVALMDAFAQTAGVGRVSGRRERERKESSDEREQQQEPGGDALHVFGENRMPMTIRVEQNYWRAQVARRGTAGSSPAFTGTE